MNLNRQDKLLFDCLNITNSEQSSLFLGHLNQRDWGQIIEASRRHLVSPQLYLHLKEARVPDKFIAPLRNIYLSTLQQNLQRLHRLGEHLHLLKENNIPVIVLKGAYLAEAVYANMGARIFSDVDLLVRPEDLSNAQRCLLDAGAFSKEEPFQIDFHWYLDDGLAIDLGAIFDRFKPVTCGGVQTFGLAPEDLLLHLCIHLSVHHHFEFGGIRTLCDLREVMRCFGDRIDWDYIVKEATRLGIERALYVTFCLSEQLLPAGIPDQVMNALKPDIDFKLAIGWAEAQIFQSPTVSEKGRLSGYFWQLWAPLSWKEKLASFRKVIAPDRKYISQKYPTHCRSLKSYIYYLVRLKNHIARYSNAVLRIVFRERKMRQIMQTELQNMAMKNWLSGKDNYDSAPPTADFQ